MTEHDADAALELMTPDSPRWEEFCERLSGTEGCDFQDHDGKPSTWKCYGGNDKRFATAILESMGNVDVPSTLAYFEEHSGWCDCEILFNVDPGGSDNDDK